MDDTLWQRLHLLTALLPLGLLLAGMIVNVLGVLRGEQRRALSVAGILILAAGALATAISAQSGRLSARRLTQVLPQNRTEQIEPLLAEHVQSARAAAAMYYLAVVVCAAMLFSPMVWKPLARRRVLLVGDIVVLLWLAATGYALGRVADCGARLLRMECALAATADPWAATAGELAPPLDQRP